MFMVILNDPPAKIGLGGCDSFGIQVAETGLSKALGVQK